jgi:AGZA family xanthine/uracil permease-like MFS transporter
VSLINNTVVDWILLWWNLHSIFDGIQSQECHYYWHHDCVDSVMAVSCGICTGDQEALIMRYRRSTSFTYFPHNSEGDERFEFFKKVVTFHPIQKTLNAIDWNVMKAPSQFALALFTFLYVDVIDCTATLYSMARFSGVVDFKTGDFPRSTLAYCTDALCISVGSLLGCSPVTAFIESGAGIAEGGKTGLTSMTTGVCFLLSLFFAPIFASIPPWATGCTLVLVRNAIFYEVVCSDKYRLAA